MNFLFGLLLAACSEEPEDIVKAQPEPESLITWADCGYTRGEHQCNFVLKDQEGNDFELYDHVGETIILDLSTSWCYYCKVAAAEVQNVKTGLDVEYITILIENAYGDEPTQEDLQLWASTYDIIDAPVLAGSRDLLDDDEISGWKTTGWPTFFIIDRDMIIYQIIRGYNEQLLVDITLEAINQ